MDAAAPNTANRRGKWNRSSCLTARRSHPLPCLIVELSDNGYHCRQMNLRDHLREDLIFYLKEDGKTQAIRELVEHTCMRVPALEFRQTLQAVEDRENVVSSWVAPGIAIPHARLPNLRDFIVSIGVSRRGIQYESADGQPVYLLVLILGDADRADQHIQLLAEVARTFRSESIRQAIHAAPQTLHRNLGKRSA